MGIAIRNTTIRTRGPPRFLGSSNPLLIIVLRAFLAGSLLSPALRNELSETIKPKVEQEYCDQRKSRLTIRDEDTPLIPNRGDHLGDVDFANAVLMREGNVV